MFDNDARSSRKKDPRKAKFFIFHDKGHFAKICPKSKKEKGEVVSSEETMEVDEFPIEDDVLHSNPNNFPKFVSNIDSVEIKENLSLFIDSQPQLLIIDDCLEKILSPISEGEFN
ncbi:hypothetical protein FXO37_04800 [Capsicum annuum]|nr:hypothetical protein FXO37_04800 [Capsicum annuum]